MADTTPKSYSADPTLYLYTSLTAGSSHIITATSRLETILKANKIPFRALDVATDEKARMLWGRRSKGKKLPGLVKFGSIVGDLEEVEEWNEYGELKQQIGATPTTAPPPTASTTSTPSKASTAPLVVPDSPSKISLDKSVPSPLSKETSGEVEPSPMSPSKKDETPLTMAMRQAGAEAAKKAGEKKASKSTVPSSTKKMDAPEVRIPVIETKMAKSVEDPSTSTELTAAKIPEKLAEEGAKRTSVDKIAEEGAKREHMDKASEREDADDQGYAELITDAKLVEARRASSATKMKSPLSEETAATSSKDLGAVNLEPMTGMHRGSSFSSASKAEIERIEKSNAIPEETEETEETDESHAKADTQDTETPSPVLIETPKVPQDAIKTTAADVTATDEGELAATKGVKPQQADAKDAMGAGTSIGD